MSEPAGPDRIRLFAPAKLNLGLRITGVRPDGYHELDSLFVALDWGDELELEIEDRPAGADSEVALEVIGEPPFSSSLDPTEPLPTDGRNLAVRAAEAFLDRSGRSARVGLRLTKRVPAGAGLGGGSSDAAAVLRGLSELRPGDVPREELARLALDLGADVPFFLDPRPSRVQGIGERIEALPAAEGLAGWWLALASPGISVATAAVYAGFDSSEASAIPAGVSLTLPGPGSTMPPFSGLLVDPSALGALLQNDLEPAASRVCPAIQRARALLDEAGAVASGMSGSGATVFGVFAEERSALIARDAFLEGIRKGEARSDEPLADPHKGWSLTARISMDGSPRTV